MGFATGNSPASIRFFVRPAIRGAANRKHNQIHKTDMENSMDNRITAKEAQLIIDAIRIVKGVDLALNPAMFSKHELAKQAVVNAANFIRQDEKENLLQGIIDKMAALVEPSEEDLEPVDERPYEISVEIEGRKIEPVESIELDITKAFIKKEVSEQYPIEIGAGNMRGILFELMESEQGHIITLEVPETNKPQGKIKKVVVDWYGTIDNAYSTLSQLTKWLFDRL